MYLSINNVSDIVKPEYQALFFSSFATGYHSPFRQTFELGIFISTAGKIILNLEKR